MDRGSSKHGPRLDDKMEQEVRAHLRGSPAGGRVQEWREPEPTGEAEPDVSAVPRPDRRPATGTRQGMSDAEREGRARLGMYLPRSAFPADRDTLIQAAEDNRAPDDVVEQLTQLPDNHTYDTVARVWAALGHGLDTRF
ncbi:MAG TPA: DUF2795 domain-containing protein [Micromonosporaceae bacterium]